MQFFPGHTYHIYNQGNNRDKVFHNRSDYLLFINKIRKAFLQHCNVLAWCLMPNHFHILVQIKQDYELDYLPNDQTKKLNAINSNIGSMLSSYTQIINTKMGRTGSLFRKRTKAKSLSEMKGNINHGINCFLYIHQNPIRAGLVEKLEDWEFSSFKDYTDLRNGNLCNQKLSRELFKLPSDPEEFYELSYRTIPDGVIRDLF